MWKTMFKNFFFLKRKDLKLKTELSKSTFVYIGKLRKRLNAPNAASYSKDNDLVIS